MKEIRKSKLATITGGTSTTVMVEVGCSNTHTENEYTSEDAIGKEKPIEVQVPNKK